MYHIFFIHSSVNGHLGSFHVLAIVDSAALKVYGRNQHNIVKILKKKDTALRWVQGITASNNLECTAYCPILFNLCLFGGLCLLMRRALERDASTQLSQSLQRRICIFHLHPYVFLLTYSQNGLGSRYPLTSCETSGKSQYFRRTLLPHMKMNM